MDTYFAACTLLPVGLCIGPSAAQICCNTPHSIPIGHGPCLLLSLPRPSDASPAMSQQIRIFSNSSWNSEVTQHIYVQDYRWKAPSHALSQHRYLHILLEFTLYLHTWGLESSLFKGYSVIISSVALMEKTMWLPGGGHWRHWEERHWRRCKCEWTPFASEEAEVLLAPTQEAYGKSRNSKAIAAGYWWFWSRVRYLC